MWLIDDHPSYCRSLIVFASAALSKACVSPFCCTSWSRRCRQLFFLLLGLSWSMPRIASPQLVPAATPQPGPTDFDQTVGMPPYAFRTYQFAADEPGKVRVEVYLGLVNDILQFVKVATDTGDSDSLVSKTKEDPGYRAQYEANVTIWDKQKSVVDSRNWKRDLIADSFDATNDRKQLNIERATFDLPPDRKRT